MADRLKFRLKADRLNHFFDRLVVDSVGAGSFTALALERVVEEQLLPMVRQRTPKGETGAARAGWHVGRKVLGGLRPFIQVVNRVFYIRFLEFGTLARRRRKLKRKRERSRLSGRGGIRALRMLGTTIRDLRASNAVSEELKKTFTRSAQRAARQAERIAA